MDNLSPELKTSINSRNESDSQNIDASFKGEFPKKKSDKIRKEDNKMNPLNSDELVAIGTSTCGRWVKFQKRLGEGGYKTVFKGYDREKGNNVAWCEFKPHHVDTKEKQVNMMHEIEIMVRMDHPNIVTCYDVFDEYIDVHNPSNPLPFKSIILIQELMGEGTLKSVIKKNFINGKLILKFTLIAYWMHQIISALNYMHETLNPAIIHRDLKADNCFLESKSSEKYLNVKVGDFGLAKQLGKKEKNTMLGTVGFMAPEVYDENYDAKVDIYAFGMLMLEVVTNRTPYDDCETVMQVAKETMSGKLPEIFNLVHDPATREVISCCIHPLPSYRPSAMELFYHPIFLNKNEEEMDMLPVEITPNFNKCIDREAMVYYFVANLISDTGTHNTKFNLRMDFRDKQLQRSLNLDEGESLEFDLDVYKEGDIPELIANLKSEYEESMRKGLDSIKSIEAKQINGLLETLFKSMELQMQFLLKMIIGKRWFFILESILSKQVDPELKDDVTGFSLLATYKKNWQKASKQLETEITEYGKLGNSDEMKKILKTFKTSDSVQVETSIRIDVESIKTEPKPREPEHFQESIKPLKINQDSIDSPSLQAHSTPVFQNHLPMYYPIHYPLYYNSMQGYIPNNQLNYFNPMMYPSQNIIDPMMLMNQNQEPLCQQNKKSQTVKNEKICIPHNKISYLIPQKINTPEKQEHHINEDILEDTDKILTLEEVMKYISSKSHRHSKHPFLIIPVSGQSNAFRLVKVVEYEESNESLNKIGSIHPGKSFKQPTDIDNLSGLNYTLPNQTFPIPPGIMGYQYPTFPYYYPMTAPICPYQHMIQQQYGMQSIQEQQQQLQQLQQLQQSSVFIKSQPNTSHNSPSNASPYLNIDKLGITDISDSVNKFVVTTITEKVSHSSSSEEQTVDESIYLTNERPSITDNAHRSPSHKKQESIKKNEKENNCNLDMTQKQPFNFSISSHGENYKPKQLRPLKIIRKKLEKKSQFNSLDSQTLSFTNSVSNNEKTQTIGASTENSCNKTLKGLCRSATYDFSKEQFKESKNNFSFFYSSNQK